MADSVPSAPFRNVWLQGSFQKWILSTDAIQISQFFSSTEVQTGLREGPQDWSLEEDWFEGTATKMWPTSWLIWEYEYQDEFWKNIDCFESTISKSKLRSWLIEKSDTVAKA